MRKFFFIMNFWLIKKCGFFSLDEDRNAFCKPKKKPNYRGKEMKFECRKPSSKGDVNCKELLREAKIE